MEANMRIGAIAAVRSILRGGAGLTLLVALLAGAASAGDGGGGELCHGIRSQDEITLVNTRNLCGSCDPESLRTGLVFENYVVSGGSGARHWQTSDLDSFLAFDPSVRTIIFIHGNRITASDAKHEGLAVYRKLADYAGGSGERIRFVIFSWPSGRVGRQLYDVRIKAQRTAPAGCQLAWLLDQIPAETPISLVGFSYGARIITGGLHILAGGSLGSCSLAEPVHPNRPPVNTVLIGAALHAHWLGDGQFHGQAMAQVDQMFLVNSRQDMAMRYYRLSTTHGNPQALGLCGPTRISSENSAKVDERDVSRATGSEHDLFRYLCASGVVGQIWETSVGAATPAPAVAMAN